MLKTGSPLLREMFEEVTRKGRQEGRREGRQEGRREAAEADIITVLKARFGRAAEALNADLKGISDARLKSILGFAATCPDLAAFRARIEADETRSRRRES